MSFFCQGAYLIVAVSNGGNLKHQAEPIINFSSNDSSHIAAEQNSFKVRLNPKAAKFAAAYLRENEEALEQVRERSKICFRLMDSVLAKYELPVELKYLAVVESELKRDAVSHVGAVGPWQLMPATARQYAVADPYDPASNIEAGIKHLKSLLERLPVALALAAYNAGEAAVQRFNGVPPYRETQDYVSRILRLASR